MGFRQATSWLKYGLMAGATLALTFGCRVQAPASAPLTQPGVASTASEGEGTVHMVVELPRMKWPDTPGVKGDRRVQFMDWTIATQAKIYVGGAGLPGWVWKATSGFSDAGGKRSATFNFTVAAGVRRVFRAVLDPPGRPIYTLEGVADVPAGGSVTINMTEHSSPTAEIFRDMLQVGDKEKVLAIPISQVQKLVDNLIDQDSSGSAPVAFDGNLDGQIKPIHPRLLDTHVASVAIMRGTPDASGVLVPYSVPSPPFLSDLAPTPTRQATVQVRALDTNGQLLTNPAVVYFGDPVSPAVVSSGAVDISLFPVARGDFDVNVVDTVNGRRLTAPVIPSVWDQQHRVVNLAMPLSKAVHVTGTYNNNMPWPQGWFGWNGDPIHNSFAFLRDPGDLAILKADNGKRVVYVVDAGNKRVRRLELYNDDALLDTVAGGGGTRGTTWVDKDTDVELANETAPTPDKLLFSERTNLGVNRVQIVDLDANGDVVLPTTLRTLVDMAAIPAWGAGEKPGPLALGAVSGGQRKLYVGSATGGSLVEITLDAASWAVLSSRAVVGNPALYAYEPGGDLLLRNDRLFYSGAKTMAVSTGNRRIYTLFRRDLTKDDAAASDAVDILSGDPALFYEKGTYWDGVFPITYKHTVESRYYYPGSPYKHLAMDNRDNLYFVSSNNDPADMVGGPDDNDDDFADELWQPMSQNSLFRLNQAMTGTTVGSPWLTTWLDVRSMLKVGNNAWDRPDLNYWQRIPDVAMGLTVDPEPSPTGTGLNDLYLSGVNLLANPNGAGFVNAHSIYKVEL